MKRTSGILLHPTSLPGTGIGSLGDAAYYFIDKLVEAQQSLWQILPLGPLSRGYSPYQSPSAFAGNPLLIDLQHLCKSGLLHTSDLHEPDFSNKQLQYSEVEIWKTLHLKHAFQNFQNSNPNSDIHQSYAVFCKQQQDWLEEYACFVALKEAHGGRSWNEWDAPLKFRNAKALDLWREAHEPAIAYHKWVQFIFFEQWSALKKYANQKGVSIIGDMPIFVAYDSADVWAHPELFELDKNLEPTVIAGVPPDYFSETGQRWGNPLYRWKNMQSNDFEWWKARFKTLLECVDCIRIDHFRGFDHYWEIPASEPTAINGCWKPSPGVALFESLKLEFGEMPIIAEDLGVITPEVEALRDQFEFPGMKILQFAFFDGEENPYLPYCYPENSVAYTATHDNNTTRGWFDDLSEDDRNRLRQYLAKHTDAQDASAELIRLAWASVSNTAIAPLQDFLNLDASARMNTPGTVSDENWSWRCTWDELHSLNCSWIREITETYGRKRAHCS